MAIDFAARRREMVERQIAGVVRFVPLIGAEGWQEEGDGKPGALVGPWGEWF